MTSREKPTGEYRSPKEENNDQQRDHESTKGRSPAENVEKREKTLLNESLEGFSLSTL